MLERLLRRVDTQSADGQRLFQLLRRNAPAKALERQIQQRRVALTALQQLVQRLGGQGDILLSAPQDIAGHGRAPSRHLTLFYMKSHRS